MAEYLVMHDYGMGAMYWWVEAPSVEDILRTYAEVVVYADPPEDQYADVPHVVLGDPVLPAGLDGLRDKRLAQIDQPGFGALVGRGPVYTRQPWPDEDLTYLTEYDPQGWRTRQVTIDAAGDAVRTGPEDWFFDSPEDLWAPELAELEITAEEFEAAWAAAHPQEQR